MAFALLKTGSTYSFITNNPGFSLLLALVFSFFCAAAALGANSLFAQSTHKVVDVIDGDTLVLSSGERVRLLGINAPEVPRKDKPGEAGGLAAKRWLEQKLKDNNVTLESGRPNQDKYGRLLAHLFDAKGAHINRQLVERGLAVVSIIPPNTKYTSELLAAQIIAETERKGMWGKKHYRLRSINEVVRSPADGWQRVEVIPHKIKYGKRFIRLLVGNNVDLRIPKSNLKYFPRLKNYLGEKLEVRGWVSRQLGCCSILVRHPSALVVIEK